MFFPERLKESTHRKYNFVTSLYVKQDVQRYKISQPMRGFKRKRIYQHNFRFNDYRFYDELRNELS